MRSTESGSAGSMRACSAIRTGVYRATSGRLQAMVSLASTLTVQSCNCLNGQRTRASLPIVMLSMSPDRRLGRAPYTEFPLVCFETDGTTRWWRNSLSGPKAIAIDGCHALVAGGYGEDANRLALVDFAKDGGGTEASVIATWALPLRRLPRPANDWAPVWDRPILLSGRGDMLHLVDDGAWMRWTVADVVRDH